VDRVRAGLRIGELVGMVLTDFDVQENTLELHFEDARLVVDITGGELDAEVR
jgi:hypothetical protein